MLSGTPSFCLLIRVSFTRMVRYCFRSFIVMSHTGSEFLRQRIFLVGVKFNRV